MSVEEGGKRMGGGEGAQQARASRRLREANTLWDLLDLKGADPGEAAARAQELAAAAGREWMAERGPALLSAAARKNLPKLVGLFVKAGAPADAVFNNSAPLGHAAMAGSVEALEALLEAGADPRVANAWGSTPLHSAAGFLGDPKTGRRAIEALLAAGADVNAVAQGGLSALSLAAAERNVEACEALSRAGADWGVVDEEGRSVFMRALASCNSGGLEQEGPRLCRLVELGASPRGVELSDWTPICFALDWEGRLGREWARALAAMGADPNERSSGGLTALAECLSLKNNVNGAQEALARVELLLELGGDPRIPDAKGRKPSDLQPPYGGVAAPLVRAWAEQAELSDAMGPIPALSKKGPRV